LIRSFQAVSHTQQQAKSIEEELSLLYHDFALQGGMEVLPKQQFSANARLRPMYFNKCDRLKKESQKTCA
jgi:hypothetical protein